MESVRHLVHRSEEREERQISGTPFSGDSGDRQTSGTSDEREKRQTSGISDEREKRQISCTPLWGDRRASDIWYSALRRGKSVQVCVCVRVWMYVYAVCAYSMCVRARVSGVVLCSTIPQKSITINIINVIKGSSI